MGMKKSIVAAAIVASSFGSGWAASWLCQCLHRYHDRVKRRTFDRPIHRRGIQRPVWTGPRWSVRHGRQCVQGGLPMTTSAGEKVTVDEDVVHHVHERDELDLGEGRYKGPKRPRTWYGQFNDHHGHAGQRASLGTSRPPVRRRRRR